MVLCQTVSQRQMLGGYPGQKGNEKSLAGKGYPYLEVFVRGHYPPGILSLHVLITRPIQILEPDILTCYLDNYHSMPVPIRIFIHLTQHILHWSFASSKTNWLYSSCFQKACTLTTLNYGEVRLWVVCVHLNIELLVCFVYSTEL